jgi:alkylation response protein AidB-like acyl-CoA dehydrogenase
MSRASNAANCHGAGDGLSRRVAPVQEWMLDAKLEEIGGGTSDIQRLGCAEQAAAPGA